MELPVLLLEICNSLMLHWIDLLFSQLYLWIVELNGFLEEILRINLKKIILKKYLEINYKKFSNNKIMMMEMHFCLNRYSNSLTLVFILITID